MANKTEPQKPYDEAFINERVVKLEANGNEKIQSLLEYKPPAESEELRLRRQQMFSREELKLILHTGSQFVHYKKCKVLRYIPVQDLQGREMLRSGDKVCKQCMLYTYALQGTNGEDLEGVISFFNRVPTINEKSLRILYLVCRCRTYVMANKLYLTTKDGEKWYVEIATNGTMLKLFHNNYHVKNGQRIRLIPTTYHEQYRNISFHSLMSIVLHYDYERFHSIQSIENSNSITPCGVDEVASREAQEADVQTVAEQAVDKMRVSLFATIKSLLRKLVCKK